MIAVLLVDDEPPLLEMTRIFLEQDGEIEVDCARSGAEALKKIGDRQYDVIVSDFEMPGMDGIEFLKQTKACGCETPFIIFTGKGREHVVIEALNYGADFYLQKGGDPVVQFAELGNMIRKAVLRKRAEDSLHESERRYRAVVEDQTEFICRFRPDGTHVFVNEAYCRYFGMDRQEIIGKKFLPQVYEDDRKRVVSHLASLSQELPVAGIDHRVVMPDGMVRWQRWVDRAILDPSGQVTEYQSVGRDITEYKANEEALRSSERRLKEIIDFLPDATFAIDREGKVIAWNQAIEEMTGVLEKEMLGQGDYAYAVPFYGQKRPILIDLIFSPDEEILDHHYTAVRRGGPAVMAETSLPRPKGRTGLVLWVIATPLFDEEGEITGAIESIRDISDLRDAQSRAEANEEKLSDIFDLLPVTVFECDREGMLTFANRAGLDWTGYTREEFSRGLNILAMIVPEEWEKVKQKITWLLAGAPLTVVDHTARRKDGSTFPVTVYTTPVIDRQTGKITGFRGVITNNSERHMMEERYKALVEAVNDCIWELDREGVFTYCSPRMTGLLGYMPAEVAGKRPTDLMPAENEAERADFSDKLRKGKPFDKVERVLLHRDGHPVVVEVSGVPVLSADGKVTGYRGVVRDVTEQNKAEEALMQVNKKLHLLSNVTRHDILNQLTVLLGYLGISAESVTDPVLSDHLARGLKAAKAIRQQILFTRDYQDVGVHTPQWQDLAATWQKAAASAGQSSSTIHPSSSACTMQSSIAITPSTCTMQSSPLTFVHKEDPPAQSTSSTAPATPSSPLSPSTESPPECTPTTAPASFSILHDLSCDGLSVYADPLLGKVFSNLIDNVARHGGNATMVRLSCHQSPGGVIIVCEDDGRGISASKKEVIFERGYGRNTGYGLFLAREILSITGLSIRETGEEGKGVRFEILVPPGSFRFTGESRL